jgi:uncharacterized protein
MNLDGVVTGTAATVELEPDPINEKWIVCGNPVARSKTVARSRDRASKTMVWHCTAGEFRWHYTQDEAMIVMAGEAFLQGENGEERCFAAGDFGFFPAGSIVHWRVDREIQKVALLHEPIWRSAGFAFKMWNKVLRRLAVH